jgi:predicted transposase/invertase (TIGR01784 family)
VIKIRIIANYEEKNVDLLDDYYFGKLFGEEGCEAQTLHLINTFTGKNFKDLSFKPNELRGQHKSDKKSITDVLVVTNNGTIVNIESQIKKQEKYHKRSQLYHSKINAIILSVGDDYEKAPMVIMINIIDFNLHKLEKYHTKFKFHEEDSDKYSMDDITEIHYIELPTFRKRLKNGNVDLNDPKDRAMILLNEKSPQKLVDKVIKMDEFANNVYEKVLRLIEDKGEALSRIRVEQAKQDREAEMKYAKNL